MLFKSSPPPKKAVLPQNLLKNCLFIPDRYTLLMHLPKEGICAEVGVLAGDFSQEILRICFPHELHLIDVFDCPDYSTTNRFTAAENEAFVRGRFGADVTNGRVHVKKGNSWDMLATYPDHYFDWVYIDAAHDYKSVVKDLDQALRVLKKNGIIIMNDYIMVDHKSGNEYGVVPATNEFMIKNNFEMIYFAFHPELFCDIAIRKVQDQN